MLRVVSSIVVAAASLGLAVAKEGVSTCRDSAGCVDSNTAADTSLLQLKKADAASEPFGRVSSVDWVVVGGGGAGCAAAAALADAGYEVVVLERGPSDLAPDMVSTQSAHGWPASVNAGGQTIRWTEGVWGVVAKVLGGGTALNGGLYFAERQEWFQRALPDLDMSVMNASYLYLREQLTNPAQPTDFGLAWNDALAQAGFGTADRSAPSMEWQADAPFVPYSTFNQTAPGQPRFASSALLHSRSHLKNLHVITNAEVQRIVFEGKRATQVEVKIGWRTHRVHGKKGVIVSAGVIFTPQLLQISGVGPKDRLDKLEVAVVSDIPGVGANFTDRLALSLGYPSPTELPLTIGYTVAVDTGNAAVLEGVGGGSITTELGVTSLAFVAPKFRVPALRKILSDIFNLLKRIAPDQYKAVNQMIQPVALQTNTHSRGYVYATSTQASDPPSVTANYFADSRDLDSQKFRYNQLQALTKTDAAMNYSYSKKAVAPMLVNIIKRMNPKLLPALACLAGSKVTVPCSPDSDSDEAVEQYLRDFVISSYHYFGTAAAGSVVDGRNFAVKGTEGLHVVDASVIPFPTTVNPQGTVMALGHYLGTLLAKDEKKL